MKKSILILCFVTLLGCSQNSVPDGLPKLVSVTLTITQDGAPLPGAIVLLTDPSGSIRFTVGGMTDAKGTVVLHTHGRHKGTPLGKFKVHVTKTELDPEPPAPPFGSPEYYEYLKVDRPPTKTYTLVEKKYTQPDTTPLELDVSGPVAKTLDVGKAVKDVL